MMTSNQDLLQAMIEGKIPAPPIADLIGICLLKFGHGSVIMEIDATQKHWNQ